MVSISVGQKGREKKNSVFHQSMDLSFGEDIKPTYSELEGCLFTEETLDG